MQLKTVDDKQADIEALEQMLGRSGLESVTRRRIEQEIGYIRAGAAGEREAAYEIEFHFGATPNVVTIHDLRIEHDGYVRIDKVRRGGVLPVRQAAVQWGHLLSPMPGHRGPVGPRV